MLHAFSRTELLIGEAGVARLAASKVAVFGVGGVGSFVVEALARCGVGHLVLIDDDVVCLTNLNRQLHATQATVGKVKVEAMKERILAINPAARVEARQSFYLPERGEAFFSEKFDYIVDAIDTVTAKIDIIVRATAAQIPVISSMGTGNKLAPERFRLADIYETKTCPLAKVMRKELRKRGIEKLRVVYSEEEPLKPQGGEEKESAPDGAHPKRQTPGSIAFVPATAGLLLASAVVRDLLGKH